MKHKGRRYENIIYQDGECDRPFHVVAIGRNGAYNIRSATHDYPMLKNAAGQQVLASVHRSAEVGGGWDAKIAGIYRSGRTRKAAVLAAAIAAGLVKAT